jgi:ankyrin repeat protein
MVNTLHDHILDPNIEPIEIQRIIDADNINRVNKMGETPLMIAVKNADTDRALEIVRMLIDVGADVNRTNGRNWTALIIGANYCSINGPIVTKLLLDAGSDINNSTKSGWTALMRATWPTDIVGTSSIETVNALIQSGSDINLVTNTGCTALMFASCNANKGSSVEIVKLLIESDADLNLKSNQDNYKGWTALMYASKYAGQRSSIETVCALIQGGSDLNVQDDDGWTALMISSSKSSTDSSIETVRALIQGGADLNLQEEDGWTALTMASMYSNTDSSIETVRALIQGGADLNLQEKDGWTALMYASRYSTGSSSFVTVKTLIDAGADINIRESKFSCVTALQIATGYPDYRNYDCSAISVGYLMDASAEFTQDDFNKLYQYDARLIKGIKPQLSKYLRIKSKQSSITPMIGESGIITIKYFDISGEDALKLIKGRLRGMNNIDTQNAHALCELNFSI